MLGWSRDYKDQNPGLPGAAALPSDRRRAVSNCPYRKSAQLASTFTLISLSATSELSATRLARNTKENFP